MGRVHERVDTGAESSVVHHLLTAMVVAGIALRLWQYLAATSLWVDELGLVRNLLDRPFGRLLFEALDYFQVAPTGFLVSESLALALLGDGEYALRLFPLICGIGSLLIVRALAVRCLEGPVRVLATAMFAFAPLLVWYSASVKQYSSDVLVSAGLVWLALRWCDLRSPRRLAALAAGGVVAPWLSLPGALGASGVGLGLAAQAIQSHWRSGRSGGASATAEQGPWIALAALAVIWGASAAGALALAFHNLSGDTHQYEIAFWGGGYLPAPPGSLHEALWLGRWAVRLFRYPAPWDWIFASLALVGALRLARRRPQAAWLLGGVLGMALLASALWLYPFSVRLSLFLLPGLYLAAAAGVEGLGSLAARRWRPGPRVLVAVCMAAPLYTLWLHHPVKRLQDTKPLFEYAARHSQPGDVFYAYYGAWQAMAYYGPRSGIPPDAMVLGRCHADVRAYLREVDQLRGHARVWVFFAHSVFYERRAIESYLQRIGLLIDAGRTQMGDDVQVRLYDLSSPARLDSATADGHSFPAGLERMVRTNSCEGPTIRPAEADEERP